MPARARFAQAEPPGLRAFSGITVGIVGTLLGVHASLAAAAGCLLLLIAVVTARARPRNVGATPLGH